MKFTGSLVVAILAIFAVVAPVDAQEQGEGKGHESNEAHEEGGHEHRHFLGAFVGGTRSHLEETVSPTAGFDFSRVFRGGGYGAGVVGEVVFADEPEFVFLVPVFKKFGSWYVRTGPGLEYVSGQEEEHEEEEGGEVTFLIRVGFGYEIELSNGWIIAPSVDLDLGGRRNRFLVFGATIGKGF